MSEPGKFQHVRRPTLVRLVGWILFLTGSAILISGVFSFVDAMNQIERDSFPWAPVLQAVAGLVLAVCSAVIVLRARSSKPPPIFRSSNSRPAA